MRSHLMPARLVAAGVFALVAGGCRHFPVGLYVESDVFEELGRSRFEGTATCSDATAQMSARLGFEGDPLPLGSQAYHRLDLGSSARHADELNAADGPLTRGLRSGDLVLAKNGEAQGLAQTLAMREFTYYDHMGLLVVEDDGVYVYEVWPTFGTFGKGGDFAARFTGEARRVPLGTFAGRYEVLELVRFAEPGLGERVAQAARESLGEDIRFDPYHDPERPELSCSEYVAHLFERAGNPLPLRLSETSTNASITRARHSLGFRNPAYLMPDTFARQPGARHAAWISRHATLAENLAVREACAYLHGSFGTTSSLGDFLQADRFDLLAFRPGTRAFLEWGKGYFSHNPTTDPEVMRSVFERMAPIFFVPRHRPASPARSSIAPSGRKWPPEVCCPRAIEPLRPARVSLDPAAIRS